MKFSDCFTTNDTFTEALKKASVTENPTVNPDISLIYVLSGRTTILGGDADGLKRELDRRDDFERLKKGVQVAREISALRAGKSACELVTQDCVIPIFYNGRTFII